MFCNGNNKFSSIWSNKVYCKEIQEKRELEIKIKVDQVRTSLPVLLPTSKRTPK